MEIAFVVVIVLLSLVWAYAARQKAMKVWAAVAQRFDLNANGLAIRGVNREVDVHVFTETRGSGKNKSTYTIFRAGLDVNVVPLQLHLAREGLLDAVGKAFGGEDVELGMPELDKALRIRAADEHEVRNWASRGDVARGLQDIIDLGMKFRIETHQVTFEAGGIMRDEAKMIGAVETLINASRALSGKGYGALLYDDSW